MNKFDIHIGQINRVYREYWWINEYTYKERHELNNEVKTALISTCNATGDYDTLKSYMDRIPNIIYDLNEFKVNIEGELIDISQWLAKHDRFVNFIYLEEKGLWRVYHWNLDRILKPTEKGYNNYFALLWNVTDTELSDDFIDYQVERGFASSRVEAVNKLKKIVLQYSGLLAKEKFSELIDIYATNGSDQPLGQIQLLGDEDKKIIIGKPKVTRKEGDAVTALNLKQTKRAFSYLRDAGIILKDTSYQSGDNINKAIQALTGHHNDSLRKHKDLAAISISDLEKIKRVFDEVNLLINRDLKSLRDHRKNL
ncbi:hypothetical protein [Fibrella aquatilis]|uniref:Uncharacterized protein n=1 Tax=Fibrella aquatilis TaxID=2817059 RepID=A0A939K104_9BACT|nr:hypothetical protein [Fibrella aquatilis]MBO0932546.1 hypothetical protein [Fibrella aquatilis]